MISIHKAKMLKELLSNAWWPDVLPRMRSINPISQRTKTYSSYESPLLVSYLDDY